MSSRQQQIDTRLAELHLKRSAIDREIAELFARRANSDPLPRRVRPVKEPETAPAADVLDDVSRTLSLKGIG